MGKKKVIVGLSGGVDSSVAAYLLLKEGYDVEGLFMRNWHDSTGVKSSDCPWLDDKYDAIAVARKLNIKFHFVDLSKYYRERVVDYMFAEYEVGRTPNPDVLCNREVKFDVFVDEAVRLGADYVATGHYCRKGVVVRDGVRYYRLIAGVDSNKDQSYFLCQLSQDQLSKTLFPIGGMSKPEVRRLAGELGLITANKRDSQGICFVGKVDLPVFLQQRLSAKRGEVCLVDSSSDLFSRGCDVGDIGCLSYDVLEGICMPYDYSGAVSKVVGEHNGAHFYTVGQRKGLNIGGFAEPLFVLGTDVLSNRVYVGMGKKHGGLFRRAVRLSLDGLHYVRPDFVFRNGDVRHFKLRFRHRQPLQDGVIYCLEEFIDIDCEVMQRGVAGGQFIAWYDDEGELIGSGVL